MIKVVGVLKLGSGKYIYPGEYTEDNMPEGLMEEAELGSTAITMAAPQPAADQPKGVGVQAVKDDVGAAVPPKTKSAPKRTVKKK